MKASDIEEKLRLKEFCKNVLQTDLGRLMPKKHLIKLLEKEGEVENESK